MRQVAWLLATCLLLSCAPDLAANGAERCDENDPCEQGSSCYRGFCVADAIDASQPKQEIEEIEPVQTADAGMSLLNTDAGDTDPVRDAGAVVDAGSSPPSPPPDAGREQKPVPVPQDAGARDAGPPPLVISVPDAGHASCTFKSCCQEAQHASDSGEKLDGRWTFKKGKCGCADADLVAALGCSIAPPRGPR